jgi:predicted GNAT family acetyltransferase
MATGYRAGRSGYDSEVTEPDVEIVDNPQETRFEARLEGRVVGVSEYDLVDGRITFLHTETDPTLKGRGVGSRLAAGALDTARSRGLKVRSQCPFMTAYLRRHTEYADLR